VWLVAAANCQLGSLNRSSPFQVAHCSCCCFSLPAAVFPFLQLLPVWLTSCLMVALLLLLTWKLLHRGIQTFNCESRVKQQGYWQQLQKQQQQQQAAVAELQQPLLSPDVGEGDPGAVDPPPPVPLPALASSGQHPVRPSRTPQLDDGAQQQQQQQPDDGAYRPSYAYQPPDGGAPDGGAPDGGAPDGVPDRADVCHRAATGGGPASLAAVDVAQAEAAEVAEPGVVPVPAGLKPLNINSYQQWLAEGQQQQQLRSSPHSRNSSATATAAETAAARLCRSDLTPVLHWSLPAASAAAAAAPDSQTLLLMPGRDTWRRWQPQLSLHNSCWCCSLSFCCPWLSTASMSLRSIQAYEARQLPWQPLLTLFLLSCWVVLSDTYKVKLPCGSAAYWLMACSIVLPAGLVTLLVRRWLLAKTAVKTEAAALAVPGLAAAARAGAADSVAAAAADGVVVDSVQWTPGNSLLYPLMCSAAGVVAGLFGVVSCRDGLMMEEALMDGHDG
jgi:hypothetical protein